MVMKTNASYGDKGNMLKQAVGLFASHMKRNTTMAHLVGKFPAGTAGAEATLRQQSTQHLPIVRCQDLTKGSGDEITFHLLNPTGGYPIMGSEYAEGRGIGLKLSEGRLRTNQARFPIDLGNVMTSIRSPADFRRLGRPVAQSLMDRYVDQSYLVQMAGARGYHDNIEWAIPTDSHAKFADIMVNPVVAPSKNRHYIASGSGIAQFGVTAGEVNLTTTDQLKMGVIDALRSTMDQIPLPPPPVRF